MGNKIILILALGLTLGGCVIPGTANTDLQVIKGDDGKTYIVGRNKYDRDVEVARARSAIMIQASIERVAEKKLIATTPTKKTTLYPDGREVEEENYAVLFWAARYENPEPLAPYVAPISETAQIITATANGITKVAGAPAIVAAAPVLAISRVLGDAIKKDTVKAEVVNGSFNNQDLGNESPTNIGGGDDFVKEVPVLDNKGDAEPPPKTVNDVIGPMHMLPGDY